jgi:hypothetical protein
MRTASELRAAALATGTFATYQGDGATVPWSSVPPPLSFTLLGFKQYLDARFPETFRLHDWLYTPYGQLINAEQEESDQIFLQEISPYDFLAGTLVYSACRFGGGLYFGHSQTGYQGQQPQDPQYGGSTVLYKATLLFQCVTGRSNIQIDPRTTQLGTNQRIAGWSESYYTENVSFADLLLRVTGTGGAANSLCSARAALLPLSAAIVGQRYQELSPVGPSTTATELFRGVSGQLTDIPQMALLCKVPTSNALKFRRLILRGIPDDIVIQGEYAPTRTFSDALDFFFLILGAFKMRINTTGRPVVVNSISAINVVTLKDIRPAGLLAGMYVTFAGVQPATGRPVGGTFRVDALGGVNNTFTITGWDKGASTGGSMTFVTETFPSLVALGSSVSRIITRKVGRPFGGYVGRASRRSA